PTFILPAHGFSPGMGECDGWITLDHNTKTAADKRPPRDRRDPDVIADVDVSRGSSIGPHRGRTVDDAGIPDPRNLILNDPPPPSPRAMRRTVHGSGGNVPRADGRPPVLLSSTLQTVERTMKRSGCLV